MNNENTFYVELSQGKLAIFDKIDWNIIDKYILYAKKINNSFYASETKILLHHLIMDFNYDPVSKMTIDHINRDSLDNRRINLRIATRFQQLTNRNIFKNNISGKTGIRCSGNSYIVESQKNYIRGSKSFSINKLGKEEAFKLASEYRNNIEQTIYLDN